MSESALHAACLRHMPLVVGYDNALDALGLWWHKVALIGKINSHAVADTLIDDMHDTRRRFQELQGHLIDNLVRENVRKVELEFSARAQAAIDILVRNLFERTADVGFLATDDDIRGFLLQPEANADSIKAVIARLSEYVAKYSVYDEIVILDPQGRVRAHLDAGNPISQSDTPLLDMVLHSDAPYVETFGPSALQVQRRAAHIFSAPITDGDGPGAAVLGVLCLCFRFDDEVRGIFANLARPGEVIAILDDRGCVIASSDEATLPLRAQVRDHGRDAIGVIQHNGEHYLSRTCPARGYQGYGGLGWQGHVMRPLRSAFAVNHGAQAGQHRLERSRMFSEELRAIRRNAALVTDDLTLVVLNGQIVSAKQDAAEFMPVLEEIRNIGQRTRGVFDESIADLYHTVVSSVLSEVQFQAFLAVDIMDRNLYERANDVRWWAQTSVFRALLGRANRSAADDAVLAEVLRYINGLYTVYSNLLLFDGSGVITAVSSAQAASWVGRPLPHTDDVRATLALGAAQQYAVSPFAATPLYEDRHTYRYLAAVRDIACERVVGGIATIFDAAPQFCSMLTDTLPRDASGEIVPGAFGVFVERDGRIIASSRDDLAPGERLTLESGFFTLKNGERGAAMLEYAGHHYAVGAAMSQGYREYKTTGDYDNDVLALIFVPL